MNRDRSVSAFAFAMILAGCSGAPNATIGPDVASGNDDAGSSATDASVASGDDGGNVQMNIGDAGADDDAGERDSAALLTALYVNGHKLNAAEAKWMDHVANVVVPNLTGDRPTRIKLASEGAWWSLKEGDFDVANPPAYSNCNTDSGDMEIGPLDICAAGKAWQVGLAGVQATGHTVSEIEMRAAMLLPNDTSDQVVAAAAIEAGFAVNGDTYNAIVASTASLRVSWLLRNSIVGFAVVVDEVEPECITGSDSWCFGTGWDETAEFAPTKTAAMGSISDVAGILDELAP